MGIVYLADQLDVEERPLRDVALKMIRVELSNDPAFARRFLQEARVAARLRSPQIVTVFDCGRSEQGELYYSMELVDGPTLKDVLHRAAPLTVEEAVRIAAQVCEALEEAHGQSQPIVHRDLKPANIFVDQRRAGQMRVKVGDFGIAKILGDSTSGLTHAGQSPGTPRYMAPEQWTGGAVDARADLYALGILLYELLSGHPPFSGEEGIQALMYRHLHEPVPPLPAAVPAPISALVEKLLAKDPQQRLESAEAARLALEAALAGNGVVAARAREPDTTEVETVDRAPRKTPSTQDAVRRRPSNRSIVAAVGAAVLLLAVAGLAEPVLLWGAAQGKPEVVRALLAAGMSPSSETDDGMSALMFAAENGRKTTVRFLLAKGADVNARTDTGESALMLASGAGHTAIVRLLLEHGARVSRTGDAVESDSGETALIAAARAGHTGIVETLLAAGSDPDARTNDGTTALISASVRGYSPVVKRLLSAGADPMLKQQGGKTALLLASEAGHDEVADIIRNAADTE